MASGMTFAAPGLLVTTPWTWSPGGSCWRSRPIATCATVSASGALTPSQGAAEACACAPGVVDVEVGHGEAVAVRRSVGQGCTIIAAWTPSKAPRSSMRTLPPPPSSAGVPSTRTVRPRSSATEASARPAPTAVAAMMLWPQAWPISGSASYSAHTATTRSPVPAAGLERGRQVVDALVGPRGRRPAAPRPRRAPRRSRRSRARGARGRSGSAPPARRGAGRRPRRRRPWPQRRCPARRPPTR